MARFRDGIIDVGGLDALLQEHQARYMEVSDEAKPFPTTERDFRVALRSEQLRVSGLIQVGLRRRTHDRALSSGADDETSGASREAPRAQMVTRIARR